MIYVQLNDVLDILNQYRGTEELERKVLKLKQEDEATIAKKYPTTNITFVCGNKEIRQMLKQVLDKSEKITFMTEEEEHEN